MAARPTPRVLLAVALVAGIALGLQVAVTRVFSAALFYHFGFLVISLALVGTGAAAMLVYLRPRWFEPPRRGASLRAWCAALALSLVVIPAALVKLDYTFENSVTVQFTLTLTAASLLSATPFFLAGMVITLVVTRYTASIHRVYAYDLVGAGAGALVIVPMMWRLTAPTILVALGLVAAVAAVLVASRPRRRRIAVGAIALAAISIMLAAVTSVYYLPTALEAPNVADRWTPLSRVVGYPSTGSPDFGIVTYDRDFATVPRHRRGEPLPDWRRLRLGPQSVGFAMAPRGRVLIIGGGGGRDIYNALSSGERRVEVVELNGAIRTVVDRDLGQEFGAPYSLPRVHVRIGDGRSTLAEDDTRYQVIHIGFTNTLSGNAAIGAALTENNLYTVEAFQEYYDHLAPGGILNVSRLTRLVGDEALRATVLTLAALEERGVPDPARHVVVLLGRDNLSNARFGTVLSRLTPWTRAELARIRRLAEDRGDGLAFAPGGPYFAEWSALARATRLDSFCRSYRVDVCPPTDDKPFFLNFERLRDVWRATPAGYIFTVKPFTVLLIALCILVGLCALAFLLPLLLVARSARPPISSLVFFAAIGLGFLVLEVTLIQRFVLFLGFPTYSLSVVLAGLLAFTGVGAALSGRSKRPREILSAALVVSVALMIASAFALPPLLRDLIDLPFGARIAITAVILGPFGLTLGMAMPIGLRRLAALHPGSVPWAWGINGVTSVLASVLAIVVAITAGFTTATLVAAACYGVAVLHAVGGRWPARERQEERAGIDAASAVATPSKARDLV
ncbi:MAG: hypothetical protein ICV69_05520 [Thermoleophilaceae bacterium]|nr:hypothetical protein [Thermoleophilaceae bacterium]